METLCVFDKATSTKTECVKTGSEALRGENYIVFQETGKLAEPMDKDQLG